MGERSFALAEIPHLARRTLWSLRKPAPDAADEAWLLEMLTANERDLYFEMDEVDRAHALSCARAVENETAEVIVASAMHDVGKIEASLGTPGRVVATICGLSIADRANAWPPNRRGLRGRIARYLDHSERGAARLLDAGSSELAVAWAREHHFGPERRTIDPDMFALLLAADDAD